MRPLRRCQIWCKSIHGGLLDEWVKYDENFIYLFIPFFGNSPTGQTRWRISCLMAQMTWTRARMCFLGVSWILLSIFRWNPPNSNFWGMNRRFQAKRAKYWKFHIIKTTPSISTEFCTTIETTKKSSWVVPMHAQQIQDGERPPFWKKNC